jgi:hypothetical protein
MKKTTDMTKDELKTFLNDLLFKVIDLIPDDVEPIILLIDKKKTEYVDVGSTISSPVTLAHLLQDVSELILLRHVENN